MIKPDHILLIEDDETTNLLNRKMLEKAFSADKIYTAENGEDAFAVIHALEAKAGPGDKELSILLDLGMPLLNGQEFLEELKIAQLELRIRIYVLSALMGKKEISQIKNFPIAGFFEKPLKEENIDQIVSGRDHVYFNQLWEQNTKAS